MRKIVPAFITAVILLTFMYCSSSRSGIIGTWDMTDSKQIMVFKNDSVMQWVLNDLVVPDTFHVKYKVDKTKTPQTIDIYNFKHGILVDKMLVGILAFKGNDSLVLDFKPIERWSDADSIRPTSFNPATKRVMVRQKD